MHDENPMPFYLFPGDQLERLLLLESEFGTLPGVTPSVDAVIDFVTIVRFVVSAKRSGYRYSKSMTRMLLE